MEGQGRQHDRPGTPMPMTQMAIDHAGRKEGDDDMMVFQLDQVMVSYRPVTGEIREWRNVASVESDAMLATDDNNPAQGYPQNEMEEGGCPDVGQGFGEGPLEEPMSNVEEAVIKKEGLESGQPRNKRSMEEMEMETEGLPVAPGPEEIKRAKTE